VQPWPIAHAQTRLPPVATAPAPPEAIYWKQDLFLVPYQWSSPAEAGAAQAVWLFVSKDRGATWQKISEARPHVTSFNYRAEGDGEYWFAVRTIDRLGRAWPAEPYQPELRVVVDTTIPQIVELSARQLENGLIEIVGRASDANLDLSTLRIEAQFDVTGTWQPVDVQKAGSPEPVDATAAGSPLHAYWQPPAGRGPLAIRAAVSDLAGNPATFQTQVTMLAGGGLAAAQPAPVFAAPTIPPTGDAPPAGWISSSAAAAQSATASPASQPWPAVVTHRAPFRLFSSGPALPDDGITAYGNPPETTPAETIDGATEREDHRVAARYAANFNALEPFRQPSVDRPTAEGVGETTLGEAPPADRYAPQHTPPAQPKLVGSRTFALEYDLDDVGRWGVTNVELWGTRDGGRTWLRHARDDDHRSPLVVTVDDEGLYGFRIVVESAGALVEPPRSGDEPELWVAVDLHRPVIELTALERGEGNLADHLILRWQAADDNLEPRPIGLFYSSRPTGPWSAIATNLEDTGVYAWRVERHVPARFYLRLEARDTAGNLAAFQTREPIEFDPSHPGGTLRDADDLGPTAAGIGEAYR
jgi:hypothetical protein